MSMKTNEAYLFQMPENNMQFLVNYTLNESIFNEMKLFS